MTVRQLHRSRNAVQETDSFSELVDEYGPKAMLAEIVLLGIGTMGAIGYDQHLDKKLDDREKTQTDSSEETP